jgi:hypothetical protein
MADTPETSPLFKADGTGMARPSRPSPATIFQWKMFHPTGTTHRRWPISFCTCIFLSAGSSLVRCGAHEAGRFPHKPVAAVRKLQAIHRGQKRLGFHLDSLRKQLPRTRSQKVPECPAVPGMLRFREEP